MKAAGDSARDAIIAAGGKNYTSANGIILGNVIRRVINLSLKIMVVLSFCG
jgi:hypothetical protein